MRAAFRIVLLAGVALRTVQYAAAKTLYPDEAAVARNVLDLPLRRLLTERLAWDQVAPPGFLAAVKLCAALFGSSELSLRAAPFVCGVLALFAFAALARRLLTPRAALLALALFAASDVAIFYGAQVKQYSFDLLAALLLVHAALDVDERPRRALLAGVVAVWFSQAGPSGGCSSSSAPSGRPGRKASSSRSLPRAHSRSCIAHVARPCSSSRPSSSPSAPRLRARIPSSRASCSSSCPRR